MHVADLRNTKAAKLFGQSPQPYVDGFGNQVPWLQEKRSALPMAATAEAPIRNRLRNLLRVSKF
jgi:hypothetical protein